MTSLITDTRLSQAMMSSCLGDVSNMSALIRSKQNYANAPIHDPFVGRKPMVASTQTAQLVRLYTKTRGKYVAPRQQYLSHFLAQRRGGILVGDLEGLDRGVASVAITIQEQHSRAWHHIITDT
jgi:hypothetical protein